jgi:predicted anti-sigma-YlaC factor YlaD
MNCLNLERLYAYLEGDLSSAEKQDIESHLAACPKCRDAVEERKRMLQAIDSLPAFEVPPDFTKSVMDRISTAPLEAKVTIFGWLAAAAAGFLAVAAALSIFALVSGQNLIQFFIRLNHGLWSYVKDAAFMLVKIGKFLMLAFKVVRELLGQILESLKVFTSLISPEAWAIFICGALLLILTVGVLWGRRFWLEKHHEK